LRPVRMFNAHPVRTRVINSKYIILFISVSLVINYYHAICPANCDI